MRKFRAITKFTALLFGVILFSMSLQAQSKGIVFGTVTDSETDLPMPGAKVSVKGTSLGSVTDNQGRYIIFNVPDGDQSIVCSYIGYKEFNGQVSVEGGKKVKNNFKMNSLEFQTKEVIVSGLREGQVRALNQQKTADNIKNIVSSELVGRFPDPNVAEALQRMPGIQIQRDQGEGRYVLIRGMEARLSSVMINGDRLPSPEGDIRTVALDVIPSDVVSSIEVNKAITPEMDADAIGGSVNLITKSASDYPGMVLKATAAGGFNEIVSDMNFQGAITYGDRFGEDKDWGILFSGSYYHTNRGSDNNEFGYDDTDFGGDDVYVIEDFELRDYVLTRARLGLSLALDKQFSENSKVYLRGIFNKFDDDENRYRFTIKADKDNYTNSADVAEPFEDDGDWEGMEFVRDLKDRYETQQIYGITAGGEHLISNFKLDYQFTYAYAHEDEPDRRDTEFAMKFDTLRWNLSDPDFPGIVYTDKNPSSFNEYEFEEMVYEENLTKDNDITGQLNLAMPFDFGMTNGEFKIGGKLRSKNKDRENNITIYDGYDGDFTLDQVLGDHEDENFLDGEYDSKITRNADPDKVNDFFDANESKFEKNQGESDYDSFSENYESTETIIAGYAQGRFNFDGLMLLAGARFEMTNIDYTGYVLDFDGDDITSNQQVNKTKDYSNIFPMIHARYYFSKDFLARAAFTTSIARPRHFDLVPYQIINRDDEELLEGNPELDPTTSTNMDLMLEYYIKPIGIISGGFFYKSLANYIFMKKTVLPDDDPAFPEYEKEQPVNGEDATLIGFELNIQHQFTYLPGFLSGFGVYANYTYTDSKAKYFMLDDDDNVTTLESALPGQSENVMNFSLSYEKSGFSARISANYHGNYIDEITDKEETYIHYDNHLQIDFSASYDITEKISVFTEILNLTDAPLRYYQGVSDRPIQQEFYKRWGHLGVRVNF